MASARRQGEQVLVHCASGTQRTGGVVAVYRMLVQGWPADRAYAEMQLYDYDYDDNPQLVHFLNQHMASWARTLHEQGVIDRIPQPVPQIVP
jgi:protein-tyrosine phosphatase